MCLLLDYVDAEFQRFFFFLSNFAGLCVGVLFLRRGQVVFSSAYLFSSLLR